MECGMGQELLHKKRKNTYISHLVTFFHGCSLAVSFLVENVLCGSEGGGLDCVNSLHAYSNADSSLESFHFPHCLGSPTR